MAYAATTTTASFNLVARLTAAYEGFKAARKRRAAHDETVRELSKLTNRELWDLGLDRNDIERVAFDHVYKV